MLTRSKAKMSLTVLTCFMMMACFLHPAAACVCPTSTKDVLYVPPCAAHTIAIANASSSLCYMPIDCPQGHSRGFHVTNSTSAQQASYCGPACSCPTWSTSCVHLLPITQLPSDPTTEAILARLRPKEICSFAAEHDHHDHTGPDNIHANCSRRKLKKTFLQVALPSGSIHVVQSLRISVPDFDPNGHIVCYNRSTRAVNLADPHSLHDSAVTGTSRFCNHHNCTTSADAQGLCFYPPGPALLHGDNITVPIAAWGAVQYAFYPYLQVNVTAPLRFHTATCSAQTLVISITDVSIENKVNEKNNLDNEHNAKTTPEYHVDVCYQDLCTSALSNGPAFTVPLPALPIDTKLLLHLWDMGKIVDSRSINCKDVCSIDCLWCWAHFRHPQCFTVINWLEVAVVLCAVSVIVNILAHACTIVQSLAGLVQFLVRSICMVLRYLLMILKTPGRYLLKLLRALRHVVMLPIKAIYSLRHRCCPHRRKWVPPADLPSIVAIVICVLVRNVTPCNTVTSFDGTATTCTRSASALNCTTAGSTILSLGSHKTETCLMITNDAHEPLGLLSLRIEHLEVLCNKDTLYFTRDHELHVQSSHRCSHSGSCTNNSYCASVKPTDILEEFTGDARTAPGFTSCYSDCGGFICGCVLFSQSCVFSRLYAVPTTPTVYEVFRCPAWTTRVTLHASLQYNGVDISHTFTVLPGQLYHLPDLPVTVTILSSSLPPMPILGHNFISDGTRIAFANVNPPNHFTGGLIGQLQCPSHSAATKFDCQFRPQACSCSPADHTLQCLCPSGSVSDNLDRYLPIELHNVEFLPGSNTISARIPLSNMQVQTSITGLKIATIHSDTSCHVHSTTLSGCFSCGEGATLRYKCETTSKETTTALLTCGRSVSVVECGKDSRDRTAQINFIAEEVEENCTIHCSTRTSFSLKGKLSAKAGDISVFEKVHFEGIQQAAKWEWDLSLAPLLNVVKTMTNGFATLDIRAWALILGVTLVAPRVGASKRPHFQPHEDPNSRFLCAGNLADYAACQCKEDEGELSCINAQFIDTAVFTQINSHYKSLNKITFHGNNFQDLPKGSLFGDVPHSSLHTLNISANYIVNLHSGALKGLSNLRVLDMSNNEIVLKEDDVDFLTHTPQLTELYLRRAFTSTINRTIHFDLMLRMFRRANLKNLQIIDLSYNFLDTVPYNLPCPFPRLQTLDLRQNFLSDFIVNASCISSLRSVDLSRNQIHSLSRELRSRLSVLPANSVSLRNSFHCDCKSEEYITWIRTTNVLKEKNLYICDRASPRSLIGMKIVQLPVQQLDCSTPLVTANSQRRHSFDIILLSILCLFLNSHSVCNVLLTMFR